MNKKGKNEKRQPNTTKDDSVGWNTTHKLYQLFN